MVVLLVGALGIVLLFVYAFGHCRESRRNRTAALARYVSSFAAC